MNSHLLHLSPSVSIHYREGGAASLPPILLLHSLSDNTYIFDPLIAAGLDRHFRIISPDLRGRGSSSRPATGYGLEDHCGDLIALLDELRIEKIFVAGHSFGGFLGLYFAAHYPQRVLGLAMIHAAAELHPLTPLFVLLLADRCGKWYPSRDAYLSSLRAMPFVTHWDGDMERTFLADTITDGDGPVYVKTQKLHLAQCALALQAVPKQAWRQWAMRVPGPALVVAATAPFLQGPHAKALETAVLLPGGAYGEAKGNHLTMMFGSGAQQIATQIIERFVPGRETRERHNSVRRIAAV